MGTAELQQFAGQLATWTELVIDQGRTPFRKISRYQKLQTRIGPQQPPLIFWINRQSMMAGGVVLLPQKDLSAELERGRACAEALSLRHFVTWETDRVRIWQVEGDTLYSCREFSCGQLSHPDQYRLVLHELLEALKLLAVIGLIPPEQSSAHYLHNLYLTTLEMSFPVLLEAFRQQTADNRGEGLGAEQLAQEFNRLTLIQLLSLLWFDLLPKTILPEKLGRVIQLSLVDLSPDLIRPLNPALLSQTDLPYDAAVCFHHLLLRLQQLKWKELESCKRESLDLLFQGWYGRDDHLGQLPSLFHPAQLSSTTDNPTLVLSESPGFLAAQALSDFISGRPPRRLLSGDIFTFPEAEFPGGQISARLLNQRRPFRAERQKFSALLRVSWPNRRFRISGHKPCWYWEALHLLGLCSGGQELQLEISEEVLNHSGDEIFWELIQSQFRVIKLEQLNPGKLMISLTRETVQEQNFRAITQQQATLHSFPSQQANLRARLIIALRLPAQLTRLIDRDFIWPAADSEGPDSELLELYASTRLGQMTWKLLSAEPRPLNSLELFTKVRQLGWPYPETALLEEFRQRKEDLKASQKTPDIDQLLATVLDCPELATPSVSNPSKLKVAPERTASVDREIKQDIQDQLESMGVPIFPEQYLYSIQVGETAVYSLNPPLRKRDEFLGEYQLEDATGQVLQVYGAELAEALLLSAMLGRKRVDLPTDRKQLAKIIDRYRHDLIQLWTELARLCRGRCQSTAAARKMRNRIWKELQLPAEKWFKD